MTKGRIFNFSVQRGTILSEEEGMSKGMKMNFHASRGGKLDPNFMLPGKATPLSILAAGQAPQKDIIPGFVRAAETLAPKLHPAPKIPASYQPHHDFPEDALPGVSGRNTGLLPTQHWVLERMVQA